ncbi:SNF-related serine/threonine-protein kinase [Fragariocoptes setiger]|uniref:SNF-related serine/threonine-protein kinase n=1 Tax=Fragariocoptes setiger TaxID=1670756 RepID=A0ABQ7S5U2_9ACAR|nr:SNF-related serine/threonine-protein kinase [Fragariocoptes setiger]KAG9508861.1 SNF-related serine/threonine-protein kinase [Fragariocoptes setiger]
MAGLYDITPKTLGKGHYGLVKLARHCLTGEPVAIKIIEKDRLNRESLTQIGTEIRILFRLSEYEHPNILKLYQVIDTDTKLHLITEFCGPHACDLHDYLIKKQSRSGLPESQAQHIFEQICSAIAYCHSLKIVHRDLKPENILVTDQAHNLTHREPLIKLIDFGFANQWHPDEKMRTSCGTLAYSAPELLLGEIYDGTKVDIWGLGIMLYILLFGNNPFMQINDNETLTKILDCSFIIPDRSEISESAKQLVRALIRRDPDQRLLVNQILCHPWLESSTHGRPKLDSKFTFAHHNNLQKSGIKSPLLAASLPSIEEAEPVSDELPVGVTNNSDTSTNCDEWQDSEQFMSLPNQVRSRSSSSDEVSSHTLKMVGNGHTRAHSGSFSGTPKTGTNNDIGSQCTPIFNKTCAKTGAAAIHYRPTSPDINGGEMNEDERQLHEMIINEMLGFTNLCTSRATILEALKNARLSHRRINGASIKNSKSNVEIDNSHQTGIGVAKYHKKRYNHSDQQQLKYLTGNNKCNDDYINATYQLLRDRIIRNTQQQRLLQSNNNSNDTCSSNNIDVGPSQSEVSSKNVFVGGSKKCLVDPFCDIQVGSASSACAPRMDQRDHAMPYALPLARKCSLVSEEALSEEN